MDALLDEPRSATGNDHSPAENLRASMAAVRVSFTWLGTRKSLTPEQRAQAARPFDAEGQYLSAGKKLLDTRHSAFKAVTAIKSKIASTWKSMSLPFPEPGVRLIRRDQVEEFTTWMTDYRAELAEAVANLDRHFGDLKQAAAERLGRLFNPSDYPETLIGLFEVSWDFPSVEPPDYLRELNPALYEAERARVAARFDEAVQMAESAFLEEFGRLVSHLTERIGGVGADGKPKVFRDSAVGNLGDFFERFRSLNISSNDQLDELVAQAQKAVRGVGAQELRDNGDLRQKVASELSMVQSALDGLMVDKPRRRIIRPTASKEV
ncbi:hypothetical protein [Tautonia marina]|uniref:hypothetical protein n=1 Tax=Tautonia marina TaxID=2653855 RepID=UPI001260B3FD|nr:hypothetical protein [Tautonia marina]